MIILVGRETQGRRPIKKAGGHIGPCNMGRRFRERRNRFDLCPRGINAWLEKVKIRQPKGPFSVGFASLFFFP